MTTLSGPSIAPASGKAARQLVIFLHGLGADGNDLLSLAYEFQDVLPDAQFISPNAPFPCDMAPFGYQWFSLQDRRPDPILDGVRHAAPILNRFIDDQLAALGLNDRDLFLIGFSQGTMMALYTSLRRAAACRGVIGYSGALVGGERLPEEMTARPPVCLIHGDADMVVPFQASVMAHGVLESLSVPVEFHRRPRLGHGIDPEGVDIAKRFIETRS